MPITPNPGEGLIRSHDLLEQLNDDVHSSFERLESDRSSMFLRRCLVRSLYAYIEGVLEVIKVEIRSNLRTRVINIKLTKSEAELIGSISYGRDGDIRFGLLDNFKRTFRLASKVWRLKGFELNTSGEEFATFKRSKKARDKLTHPKTLYDVEVTDLDMSDHAETSIWVRNLFRSLFTLRIDQMFVDIPNEDVSAIRNALAAAATPSASPSDRPVPLSPHRRG